MATIKPFSAIRPLANPLELGLIKFRLEPKGTALEHYPYAECREFLAHLLEADRYGYDGPAIYIYGYEPKLGRPSLGVWALTSAEDFKIGKIVPHENTLGAVVEQIFDYRQQVGLEGSAVLLAYPGDYALSELINLVLSSSDARSFVYGEGVHRIWTIGREHMIEKFQAALAGLSSCYIADGHHRAKAAIRLHSEIPQWVSSLFMSFDQLSFGAFHRLIDGNDVDRSALTKLISSYYFMSFIPSNRPYLPDRKGRMGMFFSGIWYQLDPRPEGDGLFELPDAKVLQDRILAPGFGIVEPERDARLRYFDNDGGWNLLLGELAKDTSLIAFTLFPMGSDELMGCADMGMALPPKSSCILPKAPFGVLMHDIVKEEKGNG